MDLSPPSSSSCDSCDLGKKKNRENIALDKILKLKQKRLKLLNEYRNEQEMSLLPLIRQAQVKERRKKKRKKPRIRPPDTDTEPSRRSERIMSQAMNVAGLPGRPILNLNLELTFDVGVEELRRDYGEKEGFEVGHTWNTRLECSHDKVHKPSIAGIHAGPYGAYSVALSGIYPDDIDEGNIVVFTGSGGRDFRTRKGGPRTSSSQPQIRDQVLNKANVSLIVSIMTGNAVRLIRGSKLRSRYAPQHGYRYDGLYRVVHYCYTFGQSGFRVFRFRMIRQDNQKPPPWGNLPRAIRPFHRNRAAAIRALLPDFVNETILDKDIEDCISKLCESTSSKYYADDPHIYGEFRGFRAH